MSNVASRFGYGIAGGTEHPQIVDNRSSCLCRLGTYSPDLRALAWEEGETNPDLDMRFRQTVRGMNVFSLTFQSLDVCRELLADLSSRSVVANERLWIDTDYGWVIEARDFLAQIEVDPQWDWRVNRGLE